MIRELWPLLEVRDIRRSVAFYRVQLGFTLVGRDAESEDDMHWCRLVRDSASIMLQQVDNPAAGAHRGISLYFVCDDADALHAELTSRGLALNPPSHAYYGMKQLYVPEPDGHTICFESPTEEWAE